MRYPNSVMQEEAGHISLSFTFGSTLSKLDDTQQHGGEQITLASRPSINHFWKHSQKHLEKNIWAPHGHQVDT